MSDRDRIAAIIEGRLGFQFPAEASREWSLGTADILIAAGCRMDEPKRERQALSEHILISAVRYALGRQTYIVGLTVDEVISVWPRLDLVTRATISLDVHEALPRCSDIDRMNWQRILDLPPVVDMKEAR